MIMLDTPQSTTGDTPFKLIFGVDAIILVEVEEPSLRVIFRTTKSESLWEEVDLFNEAREMTHPGEGTKAKDC